MDFVMGMPRTQAEYDSLWAIVDQLAKVAHFIPVKRTYTGLQLSKLYSYRTVYFQGVPMRILSDREIQVILKF
jgi:hypothetical protein